jgi:hypothetical protein
MQSLSMFVQIKIEKPHRSEHVIIASRTLFAWTYQSWYSIFLSQQNSISRLISLANRMSIPNKQTNKQKHNESSLRPQCKLRLRLACWGHNSRENPSKRGSGWSPSTTQSLSTCGFNPLIIFASFGQAGFIFWEGAACQGSVQQPLLVN